MYNYLRILIILLLFVFSNGLDTYVCFSQSIQLDSIIKEKTIDNNMTQLELLILYEDALKLKPNDSVNIFKKLAILNSDLNQAEESYKYTEKYISNTLDISILDNSAYDFIENSKEYKKLKDKYLPKINGLTFIYFYIALIGFFFAIIFIFTNKGSGSTSIFIGSYIGAHSLFILDFVAYMSNLQFEFPHTYRMSSSVALMFGPLLYLYFKSVLQNYKFRRIDVLHFLPTIILLLLLVPVYGQPASGKIKLILQASDSQKNYDILIFLSKFTSLTVYAFCIWKLQFAKVLNNNIYKASISTWTTTLYKIHLAYIVSYLLYGISAYVAHSNFSIFIYHFQIGAMSIMVIYIAYMVYAQPSVFRNEYVSLKKRLFPEKYQKSGLTEALSKELKESLIKLLIEDKIYKQNGISLEILSKRLNTTRHNTSQIVNEHFNMNFFELINKFRINEAKRLLKYYRNGNLKIIDVAYEVGYNNKVTFNKAFKKETSLTPSDFIHTNSTKKTFKVNH